MRSLAALVCRHVSEGAPILSAARLVAGAEAEPEWRFGCGVAAHDAAEAEVVPLEELVRRDPTAVEIVLHPRGTALERRRAGGRWNTEDGPVLFPHRPSRRWPSLEPRYPPRPGERLDERDLALMASVSGRGWYTLVADAEGGTPAYAFSVGLFRSYDHPEVLVFGLEPAALRALVDRIGERVDAGERLDPERAVDGLLEGRLVAFRPVATRRYPAWLGYALWYHDGPRFPALQGFWSDAAGRFPWEAWVEREARDAQPTLQESEPA